MAKENEGSSRAVEVETNTEQTKLFKRRWYMLFLYVLYMICNSSQWLQYSIIANVISKYYGISIWHVNLTSLVMMACYLPLALPAASMMERISLRTTAILGSTGTALGSCIKLFSATPTGFSVTLAGQTIIAVSQVLMLSVPQKLSSTWFGENEVPNVTIILNKPQTFDWGYKWYFLYLMFGLFTVSSACSIGVFGFQFGLVISFFLPPVLVVNQDDHSAISRDLFQMFVFFASASCITASLVIFTFQSQPSLPPTLSQARSLYRGSTNKTSYMRILKRLFTKWNLFAFFLTTGINNGCFNGLSTLLSQIYLEYFPGREKDAGLIGVTMIIFGMTASVVYGYILDITKRFKFTLVTIYFMSSVAMATFTMLLVHVKTVWVIYLAAAFVGSFLCGFTAVSFDVATEITYPESELIVGTIMNAMSMAFTFLATVTFGYINERVGYMWGNIGFVLTLFVGAACMLPIKFECKRTAAQKSKLDEEKEFL